MCQAAVGKVVDAHDDKIVVVHNGKKRELNSKLVKVKKGDYVTFSLNIAIEKIDEEEAKMILGKL
jgi:hydrogenase maturation factor